MAHTTKIAWIISVFNVCCCVLFIIFKYMVFEDHWRISRSGANDRHKIVKSSPFNPNVDNWKMADFHFIFEMCGYMMGLMFNALLPLGVNTAEEKNAFFFFPGFYVASVWLSVVTMVEGIRFGLLPYIGYSVINIMLMVIVAAVHRSIIKEKRRGKTSGWKI